MEKEKADFCTVDLDKKRESGLTLNEYVLLDITTRLSDENGWCNVSKDCLADTLNISRQSVFNLINKLIKNKWLERDSETKFIRTTNNWSLLGECNGSL